MRNSLKISTALLLPLFFLTGCKSVPDLSASAASAGLGQQTNTSTAVATRLANLLQQAAAKPTLPFEGEGWQLMFDGKTLGGWRETPFAGHGELQCGSGLIVLNTGDPFTGIQWTNETPRIDSEIALDAMRMSGPDFFCGLTVPVGTNFCSLIVGGWGGSLVGISSLDHMDASENETTHYKSFEQNRWYRIRLRITERRIEAWIDQEKVVNVDTTERRISLRPGDIELSKPFGI